MADGPQSNILLAIYRLEHRVRQLVHDRATVDLSRVRNINNDVWKMRYDLLGWISVEEEEEEEEG
jgi:hypothetical protein